MNTFFIWKPLLNIRIKCHFTRAGYKANAFLIFVSVSNLPFNLSPLTISDLKHGYDYGCGIWLLLKSEFNILVILELNHETKNQEAAILKIVCNN